MRPLDLISGSWWEYEPPSNCHDFGIGEAALASALLAAPAEAGVAGVATAASTAAIAAAPEAAVAASTGILGTGVGLSDIGAAAAAGGTLLSAKSQLNQGEYQKNLADVENQALQQKANADAAAGEQRQITNDRQTALVLSRQRALGAASGTDATSPDIVNTEGLTAQQGQYNALSSLYAGQSQARSDQYQGTIDLFKGQQAADAAPLAATGTLLSGLSSFATNRAQLRYYRSVGGVPYFSGA